MGVSEKNKAIIEAIKGSDLNSYKALCDLLDMAKVIADEEGDNDLEYALKLTDFIKRKVPTLPVSVVFLLCLHTMNCIECQKCYRYKIYRNLRIKLNSGTQLKYNYLTTIQRRY